MTTRRHPLTTTCMLDAQAVPQHPRVTQTTLATGVGICVSRINFCLKGLIEEGWIKMGNLDKRASKLSYAYPLTNRRV